jgi:large subunit ribosomal protein L1
MATHGKKYRAASERIKRDLLYPLKEGLTKVKELAYAKFDESVDIHVSLGIDPSKGDQAVRGSVVLPHNVGKQARVIVFAKGDYADQARDAGADYVGLEDLIEKIEGGWLEFEYAVATPDLMGTVGKLAKILGPRGLLPNKKDGTVTFDVAQAVKELKRGRVHFKNDKSGLINFSVGRVSMSVEQLFDNVTSFLKVLAASKPASSKGKFIKKATVSSTMGVGIHLDVDDAISV